MTRTRKPVLERLLAKVRYCETGCWLWTGTVNGAGYGTIGLGSKEQGKGFVHRVSYEHHVEPIPAGMVICHRCDVKLCVNPAHLFVGTQADNMHDAQAKGRIRKGERWATPARLAGACKGERHGNAKLTEADILEMFRLFHEEGLNKTQIAKRFSVTREMARNIINRRNWSHVEVQYA